MALVFGGDGGAGGLACCVQSAVFLFEVDGDVGRSENVITPTKQQDKNCCVLACIESLAADKQKLVSQQQIIDDYPDWCHKGEWHVHPDGRKEKKDGQVDPLAFVHIVRALKLASSFEVGTGRDFLEVRKSKIDDGIFLFTTTHEDGRYGSFHCVRLENPRVNDFYVMEPSMGFPAAYRPVSWGSDEFRGAVIIVCVP